jgi:nucleotide-binding universal stress UspA family protein
MFTFMLTGDRGENSEQSHHRLIIVGVDGSAEAEAAARWAVREAELREDDVLLVHAYEVPLLPSSGMAAAIAQGRQGRPSATGQGGRHPGSTTEDASRPAHRDRQP